MVPSIRPMITNLDKAPDFNRDPDPAFDLDRDSDPSLDIDMDPVPSLGLQGAQLLIP